MDDIRLPAIDLDVDACPQHEALGRKYHDQGCLTKYSPILMCDMIAKGILEVHFLHKAQVSTTVLQQTFSLIDQRYDASTQ